jgi:hypothetical protein
VGTRKKTLQKESICIQKISDDVAEINIEIIAFLDEVVSKLFQNNAES